MALFENVKALIIDMDGVLWHGNRSQPGLVEFFTQLRKSDLKFILATNNASQTAQQYQDKLQMMGVDVRLSEILTSGMATSLYLADLYPPKATSIYVIGVDGLREPLLEQGYTILEGFDQHCGKHADLVVCGKDETLTWEKLACATLHIRAGAEFIGTNADVTLPTERGLTHGNGAILLALEAATGVKPLVIGKPEATFYQQAITLLNTKPEETIAIGDRLDTDILGAVRTGIRSLMLLSGVSSKTDLQAVDYQPTWIMEDIAEFTRVIGS